MHLLLRVSRRSFPLQDYYLGDIKDYCYTGCFLLRGNKGWMHYFLLQPVKRQPCLNEFDTRWYVPRIPAQA